MEFEKDEKFDALKPFEIDPVTGSTVSPQHLPDYRGQAALGEIDLAYEHLDLALTADEFYQAIAVLVFHARHLAPVQHANLARLLIHPFRRGRGRPPSVKLHAEVKDNAFSESLTIGKNSSPKPKRGVRTAALSNEFATSKPVVNRARRAAKKAVEDQRK